MPKQNMTVCAVVHTHNSEHRNLPHKIQTEIIKSACPQWSRRFLYSFDPAIAPSKQLLYGGCPEKNACCYHIIVNNAVFSPD